MLTIVDYKMINLGSIINMLKKVGAKDVVVARTSEEIARASKIIMPGVGAFDQAMKRLKDQNLVDILRIKAMDEKVPFLGICLGMQLMAKSSEEGILPGLGFIDAEVKKFKFQSSEDLRIPHMGWNKAYITKPTKIFDNLETKRFYFVHSYYVACNDQLDALISTDYGIKFTSGVERQNLIGMQFHPEKSHRYGMEVFKNFVEKY